MTSEALITAVTLPPALIPRSSTDSFVMEAVTILPPPISTVTWEVVAPFFTSLTVPLIWFLALIRMSWALLDWTIEAALPSEASALQHDLSLEQRNDCADYDDSSAG